MTCWEDSAGGGKKHRCLGRSQRSRLRSQLPREALPFTPVRSLGSPGGAGQPGTLRTQSPRDFRYEEGPKQNSSASGPQPAGAGQARALASRLRQRQDLRCEFRARVGQKDQRDLGQSPLLGEESQRNEEVETKLTPIPVFQSGNFWPEVGQVGL